MGAEIVRNIEPILALIIIFSSACVCALRDNLGASANPVFWESGICCKCVVKRVGRRV